MSNEDAAKILEALIVVDAKELKESINVAKDALKKAEEYRWHNLLDNPLDVPTGNDDGFYYLCCIDGGMYNRGYEVLMHFYDGTWETARLMNEDDKVIAWKKIEKFAEVKHAE